MCKQLNLIQSNTQSALHIFFFFTAKDFSHSEVRRRSALPTPPKPVGAPKICRHHHQQARVRSSAYAPTWWSNPRVGRRLSELTHILLAVQRGENAVFLPEFTRDKGLTALFTGVSPTATSEFIQMEHHIIVQVW